MLFNYLALEIKDLGGTIQGQGPLGLQGKNPCTITTLFPDIVSTIVGVLTAAAILWFILQFILGAFRWITAQGEAKDIEGARMQIIHAVIGLVIVFIALIFISVIGRIFGIDVLDLGKTMEKIIIGRSAC